MPLSIQYMGPDTLCSWVVPSYLHMYYVSAFMHATKELECDPFIESGFSFIMIPILVSLHA